MSALWPETKNSWGENGRRGEVLSPELEDRKQKTEDRKQNSEFAERGARSLLRPRAEVRNTRDSEFCFLFSVFQF